MISSPSVLNRVRSALSRFFGGRSNAPVGRAWGQSVQWLSNRQYYDLLKSYYLNNALYQEIAYALKHIAIYHDSLKPLRNPAYRVVEFYAAKLWGADELDIVSDNDALDEPVKQIWKWSNWAAQKQVFARWAGTYGNVFTKVTQTDDGTRVYFQNIEPQYVSDYKADERGFLTHVRIDIPLRPVENDTSNNPYGLTSTGTPGSRWLTRTEVWDKDLGTMRVWDAHAMGDAPLLQLGTPNLTKPMTDFGITFIPIVHTKLHDIGEARGVGAFVMALDKIDEANLMATRLHQMLFRNNRVLWALQANAKTDDGRPLPPPAVDINLSDDMRGRDPMLELGDDKMIRLPGYSSLASLVPKLDYAGALAILQDMMHEIEKDLPELAYANIRQMNDPSGRAVRMLLSDALDRALEARSNAEASLSRLDAMALTIAANARIAGFMGLGTFENGDFDHTFAKRDIIPVDELERSGTIAAEVGAGIPLVTAVRRNGWDDAEIEEMKQDQADEQTAALQHATNMLNATNTIPNAPSNPSQPPNAPNQPPQGKNARSVATNKSLKSTAGRSTASAPRSG